MVTAKRVDRTYQYLERSTANLPPEERERILRGYLEDKASRKRQPPPPAPPGGIGIREAGRKYNVASVNISKWVRKGFIPVLLETKNIKYIDEPTLVKVIQIYLEAPGRGRWTVRKALTS